MLHSRRNCHPSCRIFEDRLFPERLANLGHHPNIAWPAPLIVAGITKLVAVACRAAEIYAIRRSRGLPRIEPNSQSGLCDGPPCGMIKVGKFFDSIPTGSEYPSHLGFCIERVWVQLFCSGQLLHNQKKGRKWYFPRL